MKWPLILLAYFRQSMLATRSGFFKTTHFGHLVGDVADETIQAVIRYMNAQYHYQALQQRHMDQVMDLA